MEISVDIDQNYSILHRPVLTESAYTPQNILDCVGLDTLWNENIKSRIRTCPIPISRVFHAHVNSIILKPNKLKIYFWRANQQR